MPGTPSSTGANANGAENETDNASSQSNNAGNDEENSAGNNEENNNAGSDQESNAAGEGHGVLPLESMHESVVLRGTVRAIDRDNRLLAMEMPGRQVAIIRVGDTVDNFDQLKVGQPATVRYTEAVALSIGKASDARQPGAEASGNKAQPSYGTTPPDVQRTVVGKLTDIDRADGTITVTTSDGRDIQLRAPDESALSRVAQGDSVYVTYREAAAVSVAPGAGAAQPGATG